MSLGAAESTESNPETQSGTTETAPTPSSETQTQTQDETQTESLEQRQVARERERAQELESANEKLLKQYEELKSKIPEPTEPKMEDFETQQEYLDAMVDYKMEAKQKELSEAQAREAEEAKVRDHDRQVENRVNDFKRTVPDFDQVVNNCTVKIPEDMKQALRSSEKTGELVYNLSKNEAELEKVVAEYKKGSWAGNKALMKYEENLSAGKTNYKPHSTVGGSGGVDDFNSKEEFSSQAEYEKYREKMAQ